MQNAKLGICWIESSESMIQILKPKGLFLVNARVPPIPASDEAFDLIHAAQVIEHFNNVREFTFFCQECWRTLRTGGLLSLTCPNYLTLGKIFFDWDYTHRLTFTKFNLERACADYGFKIMRTAYYLNWTLNDNWIVGYLRYPMLWFVKWINLPTLIEVADKVKFTRNLRLRITKNCLDNIVVIAQKG